MRACACLAAAARLALPACAALVVAGCEGSLPQSQRVDKLRVLAVRAEPPEIAPGGSADLDALVVSAEAPGAGGDAPGLSLMWLACIEPSGLSLPSACGVTGVGNGGPGTFTEAPGGGAASVVPDCATVPGAPLCLLGQAATARVAPALAVGPGKQATVLITLIVTDGRDAAGASHTALDCARSAADSGTGVPPDPDHCVIALKRVTVSGSEPRNHNPRLADLSLDGQSLLAGPRAVAAGGAALPLRAERCTDALIASGSAGCKDGSGPEVETTPDRAGDVEPLFITWFTTGGLLDPSRSSLQTATCSDACLKDPGQIADHADTTWAPPSAVEAGALRPPGSARVWAVIRDDRNGVGWLAGAALTN